MKYASAPPFRQALETRLGAASSSGGPSLARLRKEVVFDRLLARLVAVAPDRWVLKGALALDYRFGDRARTTRDIDLAVAGDEGAASTPDYRLTVHNSGAATALAHGVGTPATCEVWGPGSSGLSAPDLWSCIIDSVSIPVVTWFPEAHQPARRTGDRNARWRGHVR